MHAYQTSLEGTPRRFRNPRDGDWYVQVAQGESYVTTRGDEVLTTVLGSCISACIRDPLAKVGGMNHFLLPDADRSGRDSRRYGAHAMELLINEILKRGGAHQRLEAKISVERASSLPFRRSVRATPPSRGSIFWTKVFVWSAGM